METKRLPTLWPREHGATAQLGIALGAGLLLNWPTPRALAQVLLSLSLFAATEPLLLLLGKRGEEARKAAAPFAVRRLFSLGLAFAASGMVAWQRPLPGDLSTLIPGALLGLFLFGLFLQGEAHTATGELTAALALAAAALPVATLGGAPRDLALNLTQLLAGFFVLGTLAVRGHLDALTRKRTLLRWIGVVLALGLLGSTLFWAARGHWTWITGLSPLPMVTLNLGLALRPPAPGPLRILGWRLTFAALASALLALLGLR